MSNARQVAARAVVAGTTYEVAEWELNAPPVDFVRSLYASLPDPHWQVIDGHGHEHRWAETGRDIDRVAALPTLVPSTVHMPCDESCGGTCGDEGYDITVWHCRECGEKVEPCTIPDVQAQTTGVPVEVGPPSMRFVAIGEAPDERGRIDVTLTVGDQSWTGEGGIVNKHWSSETGPSFEVDAYRA